MIDTIKLLISFESRPSWVAKFRQINTLDAMSGVSRTIINPSKSYKNAGIYLPRLTYIERPSENGKSYQLTIELSIPKLVFGNNFSEVEDDNFVSICKMLSNSLLATYDIRISSDKIATSRVGRVDYSKNIVFNDYTPVSTIVSSMRTADISKTYDVQKTDFKNGGHIWHIHTNSFDATMYDKVADLKQEKISNKRSYEKDGYAQMYLLDIVKAWRSVSVARFEVRINGMRKLRAELEAINQIRELTFKEMYSTSLSRKILLRHWNNIFSKIPKALLDNETPEQLLLNIVKQNPGIKAREALALMGMKLLTNGKDERYIRNVLESLFTPSQYRRLKIKIREPPDAVQLRTLMKVTEALNEMKPVKISDYC
jgi:hypothetical protein